MMRPLRFAAALDETTAHCGLSRPSSGGSLFRERETSMAGFDSEYFDRHWQRTSSVESRKCDAEFLGFIRAKSALIAATVSSELCYAFRRRDTSVLPLKFDVEFLASQDRRGTIDSSPRCGPNCVVCLRDGTLGNHARFVSFPCALTDEDALPLHRFGNTE